MSDESDGQGEIALDAKSIEAKIESLVIGSEEFGLIEREFDRFCPFEALGIVRAEIRHGTFLAYLLDPFRPHGFGSKVLRTLLITAARVARDEGVVQAELAPLDIHLLDLDDAIIRREWRNIDLVVELEVQKIVVAIELKVDSSQGANQLSRYRKRIEEKWQDGWRRAYIFLTKYDEEPNDVEFWIPLRLRHLEPELRGLVGVPGADPTAKGMLVAYLDMLRRHHLANERLEEIARTLWAKHGEALAFLADRRLDALAGVFSALASEKAAITQEISMPNFRVTADSDQPYSIRFAVDAWDSLPGFKTSKWTDSRRLVLFMIKRERDGVAGLLYLGPGTSQDRQRFADILKDKRLHRPHARVGEAWMCLAKTWLYEPKKNEEFDAEEVIASIRKGFKDFVAHSINHFDPILKQLR